jgi:hypothetical protein
MDPRYGFCDVGQHTHPWDGLFEEHNVCHCREHPMPAGLWDWT